jgi:ribosomal protein S18 acetylase RimI-like enzyme
MENITYRVAQREDYGELVEWLVRVSQAPEKQCLHTWSGQSVEALHEKLLSYLDGSELCYIVAFQNRRLVGAMGSEYDEGLGRGWLHGPHVVVKDWELIAPGLFTRLLAELPPCVEQLDAYLNVENKRGRRFYEQQGFTPREHLSYDFWLTPDERVVSGERDCVLLGQEQEASFRRLYDVLFPAAYYSAERIVHMMGKSHQVLVIAEGDQVLGFAVASVEGDLSSGEVQFLGVSEDCRRRGYGRRLLLSAIDWLLDEAGVPEVSLNVSQELVHARGLYESAGFKLRFAGIGFRKTLLRKHRGK